MLILVQDFQNTVSSSVPTSDKSRETWLLDYKVRVSSYLVVRRDE